MSLLERFIFQHGFKPRFLRHSVFWLGILIFFNAIWTIRDLPPETQYSSWEVFLTYGQYTIFIIIYAPIAGYVLVPRFLERRNWLEFGALFLGTGLIISLFKQLIFLVPFYPFTWNSLFKSTIWDFQELGFLVFAFTSLKMAKEITLENNRQKELAKKNREVELHLLQAQIKPHFLFNTLNNIYSLSLKNHHQTAQSLSKLHALMEYTLVKSTQPTINLTEEIDLIQHYVFLQRLRYGDRLQFSLEKKGDFQEISILPMLLLTFIENCFKHGASGDPENPWVKIRLEAQKDHLVFQAHNSKPPKEYQRPKGKGGLGLKNQKRRLELSYPKKHELTFLDSPESYHVNLKILLH